VGQPRQADSGKPSRSRDTVEPGILASVRVGHAPSGGSLNRIVRASGGLATPKRFGVVGAMGLWVHYTGGRTALTEQAGLMGVLGRAILKSWSSQPTSGRLPLLELRPSAGETWRAILDDVFVRWPVADVRIYRDASAPTIVSLRPSGAEGQHEARHESQLVRKHRPRPN
jgi:hypothetical protein